MYSVLKEIFDEYQDIFDYDSFHVGGDEGRFLFNISLFIGWDISIYDNVTG